MKKFHCSAFMCHNQPNSVSSPLSFDAFQQDGFVPLTFPDREKVYPRSSSYKPVKHSMPGLINCHLRHSEPPLLEGSIHSCPLHAGRGSRRRTALGTHRALQYVPCSWHHPGSHSRSCSQFQLSTYETIQEKAKIVPSSVQKVSG